MVVAMACVRVMEVPVDEIVDVIAMRDGFMTAASAMPVSGVVAGAGVARRAGSRIGAAHFDHVLIDMIAVRLMQVAVVKIVYVIAVLDGDMATARSVNMRVALMDLVFLRHG